MKLLCEQYKIQLKLFTEYQCKKYRLSFKFTVIVLHGKYPQIILSYFNDNNPLEHMFISFFHELAHILYEEKNQNSTLENELNITLKRIKNCT